MYVARRCVLAAFLALLAVSAGAQSILTVAGGGTDDGHQATDVALYSVAGLALDNAGNLYIAEFYGNLVRKVAPDGTITTVAGNGGAGFGGDGGKARKATLNHPAGIVLDTNGDLYIADNYNGRIRRVDAATGTISTFAGIGKDRTDGTIGDNGPASEAVLNGPFGMWLSGGSLYVVEDGYNGNRVRKISMATKTITTIAGAADGSTGFSGDGGAATAAKFDEPRSVAVDAAGNVYVSDLNNNRVRRIDAATGTISTYAGGGDKVDDAAEGAAATSAKLLYTEALTFDKAGNLLLAVEGRIWRIDKATQTLHTLTTETTYSTGMVVAGNGDLYAGNSYELVRRYAPGATVGVVVAGGGYYIGDGLSANAAVVRSPEGLAVDAAGNLYFADYGNIVVRKVDAKTGVISTFAGNGAFYDENQDGLLATQSPIGGPADLAFDPQGNLYVADATNQRVKRIDKNTGILTFYAGGGNPTGGNDGLPATQAKFTDLVGISFDSAGNLYIADQTGNKVYRVDPATKIITTFAGTGGDPGYAGDGGQATAAKLGYPNRAVADSKGNVYISDYFNNRIRKVGRDGVISTIAGVAGDVPPPFGDGGPASSAFVSPVHIAIDPRNDDLLICDDFSSRIRRIDATSGVISTVAGSGTAYYADADFGGDNGPAKDSKLNFPFTWSGVAADATGNVFISDTYNNRVRAVFACVPVGAPQLTAVADGLTAPVLAWSEVKGAFRYDVRLDTVSPPQRVIASDLTESTYAAANLTPGTKYYWSITAKGDPFCPSVSTAASAISSFTTAAGCGVGSFDLALPADGAQHVPVNSPGPTVTLTWQPAAGATSYDVYAGSNNPPGLVKSGVSGTTYNVAITQAGPMFWFVVAQGRCANQTATSSIRSFSVDLSLFCDTNPNPAIAAPAAGASGIPASVDLTWTETSQAVSGFDVYFGTTSNPPLLRGGLAASVRSFTVSFLDPGTTYYWRVVAHSSCGFNDVATSVASFITQSCAAPGGTQFLFTPASVSTGATYTIVWSTASGLEADGAYIVERSTSPAFDSILDSQVSSSTAASFVAGAPGTIYHRVRAIPACDPSKSGPASSVASVNVVNAPANIIITVPPQAVVTSLGEKIEDRTGTFTIENIGAVPAQIIVGQAELPGSRAFFSIAEGGAFITLQPRVPRTFTIQYSGPPNNVAGSYQGVIFANGINAPLPVTPYAFVNLKVGGGPAVAPQFVIDGTPGEYAAFPGFPRDSDDSNRPAREITIRNPGTTPMELAAEISPEVWLVPENGWNAQPLDPGTSRTVRLKTQRGFALNGSPLPRYTYFTVRTKDGATSRLLVQDNDSLTISSGRATALDANARSFIVADGSSLLRLSNSGGDAVQVELLFTPSGTDGFSNTVKRAVVVVPSNDVITLTNPVVQVFGLAAGTAGQIEVRMPRDRVGLVSVRAAVPVVTRGEGARAGAPHVISIPVPGATTLTLAETSGADKATVSIVTGTQTISQDLQRYGMTRIDIGSPSRIEIDVNSGGGSVIALATAGGATYVSRPLNESLAKKWGKGALAGVPSVTTVVPVISGVSSAGATPSFRTAIGLSAQSAAANFVLTFYPSGGGAAPTYPVTVPAGQMTVYNDVMRDVFKAGNPSDGNLYVVGPPNGKVVAVLQTATSGGPPSPSTTLPLPTTLSEATTSANGAARRPLAYDGLEQSVDSTRGSRWLLLLNEMSGGTGFVNVRLYEAGNRSRPIAEKDLTVSANQQLKLDTVFAALGLDSAERRKDRTNVEVVVTATAGTAQVAASAVSIDNRTGETKVVALTPSVGSGNPNVSFVTPVVTAPSAPGRHRAVGH